MASTTPVILSDGELQLDPVDLPEAGHGPCWGVRPSGADEVLGRICLDTASSTYRAMLTVEIADGASAANLQSMALAVRLACQWAFTSLNVTAIAWLGPTSPTLRTIVHDAGFRVHPLPHRAGWAGPDGPANAWFADLGPQDLARARTVPLTAREQHVLAHMARGRSNAEIAQQLGISENTVKNHVRSILEHLQAPSRTAAVVTALATGQVSLDHPS